MRKTVFPFLAALLVLTLLCGCSGGSDVTVSVQTVSEIVGMGSVGLYDCYAGVVEAGEVCSVEKDPDMEIAERKVSAGDEVQQGDVLFTYDTEAVTLELEKKKLELEQLNAEIRTKTAQIEQLEKEKERVSASDQLDYTLQIQELQIDLSEAALNVTAKEKEIERCSLLLENSEVTAPVDGRVQTVNENGSTDDYGMPLPYMTIAQAGAFRVKGSINEQSAGSLLEGTSVTVRSRTDSTKVWSGTVELIDWSSPIRNNSMYYDVADEFTGSSKYPFYIALDSDEGLMLGQHVYIEPDIDTQKEGLMLPACYLVDVDTDPFVWAANSHERLEKRAVKLGAYDEMTDCWEITDGLSAEDSIAFPDETCTPGAKTVPYTPEEPSGEIPDGIIYGGIDEDFEDGAVYEEDGGIFG